MEKHGLPAVYNALMSGFGEEIGTGDIRYIQDIGQKLEGTPYLDKNTNKLYLCVATTNSTNNDSSFIRFDMKEAFAKLQNLSNKDEPNYTIQTEYGELLIYERRYGIIKFFVFTLNVTSVNEGLNTLNLVKLEDITKLNITDYMISINASYNANITFNTQYQNNTIRLNTTTSKPSGGAVVLKGFSRLIYTN